MSSSPVVHDIVHEEFIINGEKGLMIKFFHKENKEVMKVIIVKKPDGFLMKTTMDGKTNENTLSKADLVKELKKHKQLKFALDYVESAKDLARPKRAKKAGSRKAGSKKAGSRKGSKRGSKRGMSRSRKGSKKGSKRGSKRGSRK